MASNVELVGLAKDLAHLEVAQTPVRVGLVGCGEMGTDIVSRIAHMDGIRLAAISEVNLENALNAVEIAYGDADRKISVKTDSDINNAIKKNKIGITDNFNLLIENELIDVIVDATGVPTVGADVGMQAIRHNKHVVMMNVEADVTIGHLLKKEADKQGVVYTLGAGDEPSSCMELINFVSAMGHPIVCAGKGKNNPLDFDAIPDDYIEQARQRNMNPRMLVEFIDGSKTMVEMVCIANATGLIPDIPGMHGPASSISSLAQTLIPKSDGGVLSDIGRVDYSVGKGVSPGVFVIADMSHSRIRERMNDLKMGEGPYYTFHRPFHLTSLEVPLSCARAVLYESADMQPVDRPVADVCAIAKKDLKPGEKLDSIGEYCYRAWAMKHDEASRAKALPCGLLYNATVSKAVAKGELLTVNNANVDTTTTLYTLRQQQDALWNS